MTKVFIGFLLLFLNFEIDNGLSTILVLPDCLGFAFIYIGLREFEVESKYFKRAVTFTKMSIVATIIQFLMYFTGYGAWFTTFVNLYGILCSVLELYVIYLIVKCIEELEYYEKADYNSVSLRNLWVGSTILQIAALIIGFISPYIGGYAWADVSELLVTLSIVAAVAAIVVYIIFLVKFNNTRKRIEYENYQG